MDVRGYSHDPVRVPDPEAKHVDALQAAFADDMMDYLIQQQQQEEEHGFVDHEPIPLAQVFNHPSVIQPYDLTAPPLEEENQRGNPSFPGRVGGVGHATATALYNYDNMAPQHQKPIQKCASSAYQQPFPQSHQVGNHYPCAHFASTQKPFYPPLQAPDLQQPSSLAPNSQYVTPVAAAVTTTTTGTPPRLHNASHSGVLSPSSNVPQPAPKRPAQMIGKDIISAMPGSLHFVSGWSNFHHLDNEVFQEIVRNHLGEKLTTVDTKISLKAEVGAVLDKAKQYVLRDANRQCKRLPDVRIWKVVGEKKNPWFETIFEDVTADMEFVERKLSGAVMDTELRNLRKRRTSPATTCAFTTKEIDLETPQRSRPEFKQLNVNEHDKTVEICLALDEAGVYICSLFTIKDCYTGMEANEYLANQIIPAWESGSSTRFVIKIDCDQRFMADSYQQARLDVAALHHRCSGSLSPDNQDHFNGVFDSSQQQPKRMRRSYAEAASAFYETFLRLFPEKYECVLVFKNVPPPKMFDRRFLPAGWFQNDHCQSCIRGVIFLTGHPDYVGDMGPRLGTIVQHVIEWKSRDVSKEIWLDRRTDSTLPFRGERVEVSKSRIDADLEDDGSALAIVDCEHPDELARRIGVHLGWAPHNFCNLANTIGIQWGHRWKSAPTDRSTHRCVFRLRAENDSRLRESYYTAMKKITHSSAMCPIGNPHDSTVQDMGDTLMSLIKLMTDCSLSLPTENRISRRWGMVFTSANSKEPFHTRFPSQQSNWWNSDCRFLVATCCNNVIQVQCDQESDEHIGPIPTRHVEEVLVVPPEAHAEPH